MTPYVLRKGDLVVNGLAFGDLAFTVLASDKSKGRIKVSAESAKTRKGGWFSAPFNWKMNLPPNGFDFCEFVLPEEDIKEEAETQAPPPEIKKGDRALVQAEVDIIDVDHESAASSDYRYRCEFPNGSTFWLPTFAVKPLATPRDEPTVAENQAYELGIEEGRNQVLAAILTIINREIAGR